MEGPELQGGDAVVPVPLRPSSSRGAKHERWLVTGAGGQLGRFVLRRLRPRQRQGAVVLGVAKPDWRLSCQTTAVDLRDADSLSDLFAAFRPTHVVHLAGMSSPQVAAARPDLARLLNVDVTMEVARLAEAHGTWLLFTSSDWVFDGRTTRRLKETDETRPETVYGGSKLKAEGYVLSVAHTVVLRLPLLCGLPLDDAARSTWRSLRERLVEGHEVQGITDEVRTPMQLGDAADVIVRLGERRLTGLVHAAGPDVLSPYEVIRALATSVGRPQQVVPVRLGQLGGPLRPHSVPLDAGRLRELLPDFAARPLDVAAFAPLAGALSGPRSVLA